MERASSHRASATGTLAAPDRPDGSSGPGGGRHPRGRTVPALLRACCLSGCGDPAPATLEALLEAHVRTQPRYPSTLRLVHEVETHAGRWRVVTSIRSRPFAYREDVVGNLIRAGRPVGMVVRTE